MRASSSSWRGACTDSQISPAPSKYDVVAVAERAPQAVLCLVSALDFHEIGTQIPAWVSIAIGPKDWHPQFDYPPVRVFRMSGEALTAGVVEHSIDGTRVRVFGPAKTVAAVPYRGRPCSPNRERRPTP